MCGIAGLIHCGDPALLHRMVAAMAHRGPDSEGCVWWPDLESGLGHRRLAILDLSPKGHQPMASADRNGGKGKSFKVASVTTPSIPSEPTNNFVKSNPVLFL